MTSVSRITALALGFVLLTLAPAHLPAQDAARLAAAKRAAELIRSDDIMRDVSYLASDLVARSFPVDNDRAGLLAMIESTVAGDKMDVGAHWTPEGVRFAFRSAVLSAVKAG